MGIIRFLLVVGVIAGGIRSDEIQLDGWPQGHSSVARRDALPSSESIEMTAVDPTDQDEEEKDLLERQISSTCGAEPILSCPSSAAVTTTKGSLSFTIFPAPVSGPSKMLDSTVGSTTTTAIWKSLSIIETTQIPTSTSTAFSTSTLSTISTIATSTVIITNSPIPISLPRGSTKSSLTPPSLTALSSVTSTSSSKPSLSPQILTSTGSSTLAPSIKTSFATHVLTVSTSKPSTTFSPVIAANPAASSSPKLSSGVQIGMGVGAGLVTIVLLAVGLVLYKRKKTRVEKGFKPKEQNYKEKWSPFETRADNRSDVLVFDGKERSRVVEKDAELGLNGREIAEME